MAGSARRLPPERSTNPTWGQRVAALRYVPPLLRMVWSTHRGFTATMAVLRVARAFIPVATLWIGKLIIDAVIALRRDQSHLAALWKLVAIEIAIVVAGEVLARASALVESLLAICSRITRACV